MGGYGVDLFFVLSGFLITGILIDSKGQSHFFRNFYCRRILRIFPLFYCFITFTIFLLPVFAPFLKEAPYHFGQIQQNWAWYYFYLSNFFIAQKGYFSHGGIDITWSLAIEEHFYFFWPLLVYLLDRARIPKWLLFILSGSVLIRCLMWLGGASPIQIYVLTFSHLDSITLGAFLAAYLRTDAPSQRFIRMVTDLRLLGLSCLILAGLFAAGLLDWTNGFLNTAGYLVIAVFFTQLLAASLNDHPGGIFQKLFTWPFLITAGKYSYAMYLFHLPICTGLRLTASSLPFVRDLPKDSLTWQLFFYAAVLGCTLLAAWISWNILEKHALKLKRIFVSGQTAAAE